MRTRSCLLSVLLPLLCGGLSSHAGEQRSGESAPAASVVAGATSELARRYERSIYSLASFAGRARFCKDSGDMNAGFYETDAERVLRELTGMVVNVDPAYKDKKSAIAEEASGHRTEAYKVSSGEKCDSYVAAYKEYAVENKLNDWRVRPATAGRGGESAAVFWGRAIDGKGDYHEGVVEVAVSARKPCKPHVSIAVGNNVLPPDVPPSIPVKFELFDGEIVRTVRMQAAVSGDGTLLQWSRDSADAGEDKIRTVIAGMRGDKGVVRATVRTEEPFSIEMHSWKRDAAITSTRAACIHD